MIESQIKELCQKLKPILGNRADGLWLSYITAESPNSKREMEGFIQICGARYLSRQVDDKTIYLPPPNRKACEGEFSLGTIHYGGKRKYPLYLTRENFQKHLGIFSITGGGKTNVGIHLLLQLLKKKVPFMAVDWKRSYRAMLTLNRPEVKRLRIFTVGRKTAAPFNWNPLRGPPSVHPRTWISVLAEVLEKSHISGQGVADILMNVLDEKFDTFGVYENKHDQYPNFFDIMEDLNRMRLKGRRMLWHDSSRRIIRTFVFGPAAETFNARQPEKLEELLSLPVIFELDQELPKPLRVFFSEIILRWIHLYRLGQGESTTLRHVTLLEEAHNLFPRGRIEHQSSNSLETVFREIRSFGEGLITITQHPSLLPIYILGNCNTQIYLGLQHQDDIVTAKRALFLEPNDEVYLDWLQVGEGIVKIKGRVPPCNVRFPYVPIGIGKVTDQMLKPRGETHAKKNLDTFGNR